MIGSAGRREAADAVGAVGDGVRVEEHDRDDLAEPEGHDREVVAAQAERRRAEQDAEQRRDARADEEHRPEHEPGVAAEVGDDVDAQDAVAERRGDVGVGVGADREERRVAEVEQAGHADDEVEARARAGRTRRRW